MKFLQFPDRRLFADLVNSSGYPDWRLWPYDGHIGQYFATLN
jgi:hypothetical protein